MTTFASTTSAATLTALRADPAAKPLLDVRGPVLLPADAGFADEIAAWNAAVSHTPAIVIGATGAEDVAAAVQYAAARGLRVAVQATGHGAVAGVHDALLVTTRRMDGLHIDPESRIARVAAGVKWGRVIDAAAAYGLAPLNGSTSDVGVVGYSLGGGMGPMARTFGFAADYVRALEVVTADGQIRRVDADHSPDLFWALRGGKGNFGIVTAIEFELLPVTRLYGGALYYPGDAAPAVLHAFREWTLDLPEEANTSVALLRLPDEPFVPQPLRGQLTVHLRYAYVGDAAEGERLVAAMRAVAPALLDDIKDMPYTEVDSIHRDPVNPMPSWDQGMLLDELTADAVDSLLAVAGPGTEIPLIIIELRLMGGAVARRPAHPNAVAGRDGAYSLNVIGPKVPALAEAVPAAGAAVLGSVAKYRADGALVNFLGGEATPAQVQAAWSPTDRHWLLDIKAQYDPTGMFTFGHSLT